MWTLLLNAAWGAAPIAALPPLRPGVEAPFSASVCAGLIAEGATISSLRPISSQVCEGTLTPADGAAEVVLRAGDREQRALVRRWEPANIVFPERLVADADAEQVVFLLRGEDIPEPHELQWALTDAELRSVTVVPEGLQVELGLTQDTQARFLPIGVRDARSDGAPVWGGLWVRSRVNLSYQTDPDTTLTLAVGQREYGPYRADRDGIVQGWIHQYPGEVQANATFTDALGNFTKALLPLSFPGAATMLGVATGPIGEGLPPPVVFLAAFHANGTPWSGGAPNCQAAGGGLALVALGGGQWAAPLAAATSRETGRILCHLGEAARTDVRLEPPAERPSALRMRVWPEELSADFPVAELSVRLEDARGDALPSAGVRITAGRGEVRRRGSHWEYVGDPSEGGDEEDWVRAEADLPRGSGPVASITLGYRWEGESLQLSARALNSGGFPVPGEDVVLQSGGDAVVATTDDRGWASADLRAERWGEVALVSARTAYRSAAALIPVRGASDLGHDVADLRDQVEVRLYRGRVAALDLEAPLLLVTGTRAIATIQVRLRDQRGETVAGLPPEVRATEGLVSDPQALEDGSWAFHFTPPSGEITSEITLTASAQGRTTSTKIQLIQPKMTRSLGIGVGALSNLHAFHSPLLSSDFELMTPWAAERVRLRWGVGWYQQSDTLDLDIGLTRISGSWIPLSFGVLVRDESRKSARWAGVSGLVTLASSQVWYDGEQVASGWSTLPLGFSAFAGVGWRFPGGEFMTEMRAISQASSADQVGYLGSVGGLGVVAGYRIPW